MKRNLIYSAFAALLLASCSSDDIPVPAPAPETLDAYISLAVSNGLVQTKAEAGDDAETPDASDPSYGNGGKEAVDPAGTTAIKTFTVAIFRGKPSATISTAAAGGGITAPVVQPEGALVYLHTFDASSLITSGTSDAKKLCKSGVVGTENGKDFQINGIKVKAGNLDMLIMANMPDDFLKGKTSLTKADFENATYANLANEGFNNSGETFPCSMSSQWISVNVDPTAGTTETAAEKLNNQVYYIFAGGKTELAQETIAESTTSESERTFDDSKSSFDLIPLYRNVSAVGFQNITLDPAEGWGKTNGAKLVLNSVFVANAISATSMTIGTAPAADCKFYSGYPNSEVEDGSVDETSGALASQNVKYSYLNCEFTDENNKLPTNGEMTTGKANYYDDLTTGHKSVGQYFMVYENSKKMNLGEGKQTLLILCANYIYKDDQGKEHTLANRYYAVIVNDENSSYGNGSGDGTKVLVGRNYIYKVNLTVVGPGSEKPYDPLYTANATAAIEAAPWSGAVDIDQDAE